METVKKHKMLVVGLLAAAILVIVAFIAVASVEKPVSETAVLDQGAAMACQGVKTCTKEACLTSCPCPAKESGECPAECPKGCCAVKNAEEKVKSCPLSSPKSCCPKG